MSLRSLSLDLELDRSLNLSLSSNKERKSVFLDFDSEQKRDNSSELL